MNLDQTRPLNFSQKKRNCHIKFMSIDDQVAIMGNGNMDSQSWFHSQVRRKKDKVEYQYVFDLIYLLGNQCYDRFTIDSQRLDGCIV